MNPENVSADDADSDMLTNSCWYKNILANTHRTKMRHPKNTQHLTNSTSATQVHGNTQTDKPHIKHRNNLRSTKLPPTNPTNEKNSYFAKTSTSPTTPPQVYTNAVTTSTNQTQNYNLNSNLSSNTLTIDPFYPKSNRTMTTTTNNVDNVKTTASASCTLAAIARTISDKILLPPKPKNMKTPDESQSPTNHPRQKHDHNKQPMLVPKNVPPPPTMKPDNYNSSICTPITIRIRQPNPTRTGTFDHRRILEALLHAFQQVDPVSSIQPRPPSNDTTTFRPIFTTQDIPTSKNDIEAYMEHAKDHTDVNYRARIILNSNLDLQQFKRNPDFIQWLRNENIKIDRNPLRSTLKPQQIGFFSHLTPRKDQTLLYEQRAQLAVTNRCPPFFLQVQHMKAAHCLTKVWNVYAAPEDADELSKELKKAFNKPSLRQFFTWKEYQSIQLSQQLTILQLHNTFLTDFRSLLIHGFKPDDNGTYVMWDDDITIQRVTDTNGHTTEEWEFHTDTDDIVMSHELIEDRFHKKLNLTTTTISTFIQKAFLSGDETPVFAHVYDQIQGTREVIVPKHHIPEALDLIKTIRIELCRTMNHRAIIKNFPDYDDVILSTTTTTEWQPFDIQLSVEKAANIYQYTTPTRTQNKRTRTSKLNVNISHRSYAEATNSTNHYIEHYNETNSLPTTSTTSTITNTTNNTNQFDTSDSVYKNDEQPTQAHITSLYKEIKTIHDTLTNIQQQVEIHKINQSTEIEHLESRFTKQLQTTTETNLLQIEETSQRYLLQMHTEQSSNLGQIKSMLEERENSIEQKINDNFEKLLSKLNYSNTSPTRKKHTSISSPAPTPNTREQEDAQMANNDISTLLINSSQQKIINPYAQNTLQRRSSGLLLPTTAS
jgi:hypothetical protein